MNSKGLLNDKSDDLNRFLHFDLGEESYAVDLLSVKEVVTLPETTPVPNSPNYFMGIINLRGQIISIVDLRLKMGIRKGEGITEEAVIILDFDGIAVGVIVDSINKVLNISHGDITEVPEISTQVNVQYVMGVYNTDEGLTILLDMEKVLNIDEIRMTQLKSA